MGKGVSEKKPDTKVNIVMKIKQIDRRPPFYLKCILLQEYVNRRLGYIGHKLNIVIGVR